jgi:hypothetical protein
MKFHQKKMSKKQNTKKYNSRRLSKKFKQHGGWPVNCVEMTHGHPQVAFTIDVTPDNTLYDVYKQIYSNLITRYPHISLYQMHVRLNDQFVSWKTLIDQHAAANPEGVTFLRLIDHIYRQTKLSKIGFKEGDWFTVRLIPNTTVEQLDFKTLKNETLTVSFNRYDPIYIVKEKLLQQNPQLAAEVPDYQYIRFIINGIELADNLEPIAGLNIDSKSSSCHIVLRLEPKVDNDVTHAYRMAAALPVAPAAPPPPPPMPAVPAMPVAGGRYKRNY